MARILVNGEWFEQIYPASLYEAEFETIVLQNSPHLFPNHFLVPFKILLFSDDDSAIADMALVEKQCREWWLVEVEMSHHSLDGHVIPQVRTLSRCTLGPAEADILAHRCPQLEPSTIHDLVKGRPPRVLVVLNAAEPSWMAPLRQYDAELAIVEIFRSQLNRRLFRVNGFIPSPPPSEQSRCAFDPMLPGFLMIESPAPLSIPTKDRVPVEYQGGISFWERVDSADRVWLSPIGSNPLPTSESYELVRRSDGVLELIQSARVARRTKR